jgi:hypothetical protein
VVIEAIAVTSVRVQLQPVADDSPLLAFYPSVSQHTVVIVNVGSWTQVALKLALPVAAVQCLHRILGDVLVSILLLIHHVQYYFLTVVGVVVNMKI